MMLKGKGICENIIGLKQTTGKVAGIYEHCFNILNGDGQLITVFGDTDQYSTRAVLCEFNGSMQALPIRDGEEVILGPGKIQTAHVTIDWSEAEYIHLQRSPLLLSDGYEVTGNISRNISRNMETVLRIIKSKGKGSPLLEQDSMIRKKAAIGMERLKKDYVEGLRSLVGLGIGLTPSCDDLLGGMAAWMYLTGKETEFLTALRSFLREYGAVYTTAVSSNLLYDIACGVINHGIYELICAIIGDGKDLERLTGRVMDYGSTSGMETCLGIVMGYHFEKDGE